MEFSIVSEEFMKPSPSTPIHLRNYQISFLDQPFPTAHSVVILFYAIADDMMKQRLLILKQSLSTILASFFPLAGRIKDKFSIDCNDEGLYYVEASVNSNLLEFLKRPESSGASFLHSLLPVVANTKNLLESSPATEVAMMQVTSFACGGIAICASISHMIMDATSFQFFFKSWAASAAGVPITTVPNFNISTVFPQTAACPDTIGHFLQRGRFATKRFLFDAEAIAALKARASISHFPNPSRVEVLSAFICKSVAAALNTKSGTSKAIYASYVVNIRSRAVPPFSESCMGSYLCLASVALGMADNMELPHLAFKLREATRRYNSDLVKSLEYKPAKYMEILKEMEGVGSSGQFEHLYFSSLCNIGFNDIDFGWGKPLGMAFQGPNNSLDVFVNDVILTDDARCRGGIEARITLEEEVMRILEQNKEWNAFAALDPYPIGLLTQRKRTSL